MWKIDDIKRLIEDRVQESLLLDYKAADALQKTDGKKIEITKDVSALANSDGGIIIYGIREYTDREKKLFPERIDVIDQSVITKEWLQQIINGIRPKIENVIIYPIIIEKNNGVYVVEVPKSTTAHQARDYKYYKRYNSVSVPMEDYEIRDVMNRAKAPLFSMEFKIYKKHYTKDTNNEVFPELYGRKRIVEGMNYSLNIGIENIGNVYANFVNVFICVPTAVLSKDENARNNIFVDSENIVVKYSFKNTIRDIVDYKMNFMVGSPVYGASRYEPILPKLSRTWNIELRNDYESLPKSGLKIDWEVFADNAIPLKGNMNIESIEVEKDDGSI